MEGNHWIRWELITFFYLASYSHSLCYLIHSWRRLRGCLCWKQSIRVVNEFALPFFPRRGSHLELVRLLKSPTNYSIVLTIYVAKSNVYKGKEYKDLRNYAIARQKLGLSTWYRSDTAINAIKVHLPQMYVCVYVYVYICILVVDIFENVITIEVELKTWTVVPSETAEPVPST